MGRLIGGERGPEDFERGQKIHSKVERIYIVKNQCIVEERLLETNNVTFQNLVLVHGTIG